MNAKLIYLYFIAIFAACSVASCTHDAPDSEEVGTGTEMIFEVADESRASAVSNSSFKEFALYGDMKFQDYVHLTVFNKTVVSYKNGKWIYGDTQYWFPKHEHSFVALHPSEAAGLPDPEYTNSQLSFTYTTPDNFEDARDLMAATHRRLYADISSPVTPVILRFSHIMTRVDFNVKNEGAADVVRVNKIELEGVNRTGSFSIIPAPLLPGSDQTDDYDFAWTGISNKDNLMANISVDIPEDETRSLFPDDNALIVVPQPDNKGVIMHITYTLYDANAQPEQLTLTAQAPIGGWEPGKVYTYNLAINEITQEIYVTVSVKNWQTPKPTGITVPES